MRLKQPPPSMRERRRYLVFEVLSDSPITKDELLRAIIKTGIHFLGELEYSSLKLSLLGYDRKKQKGIIRFMYKKKQGIKAILMLLSEINGKRLILRSLGVSGTIKKAREKWW